MILALAHRLDDEERAELGRLLWNDGESETGVDVEPLLSCAEAAWRARCHVETIRRAVNHGALRASRAGRNIRIAPTDLDDWLGTSAAAPHPPAPDRSRRRRAYSTPMRDAVALLERSSV
jgi:excisionase family DNA binding protein